MKWIDGISPVESLNMFGLRVIVLLSYLAFVHSAPKHAVGVPYPIDGRIVGGQDADIVDYPYQLSLIYIDFGPFCGGVLISPNWALTAAHCTDDIYIGNITIRAGSSLRDSNDGIVVQVTKIIQHPDFSYATGDSDISLLQLSTNIVTANASPIGLATTSPKADEIGTVTGWGITSEDDESLGADILQVLEVPIVSQEDCQNAYAVNNESITDNMFCAGILKEGGKDSCTGDSGGPMVVGGVVSGIVSWGYGCAEPGFPGVYTDVSKFRDWIKENSGI